MVTRSSALYAHREDKVLVGVVLWNDLAIALADYGREQEQPPPSASDNADGLDHASRARTLSDTAAAATGEYQETCEGQGVGLGEKTEHAGNDPGYGSVWPKLGAVANEIRSRVGWLPRQRMAEAALLM